MNIKRLGCLTALVALTGFGCGSDDEAKEAKPLELIGEWESRFGDTTYEEVITEDAWGFQAIVEYDNAENIVITQNPDGDDPESFPNTYSRLVYLEPEDDSFYYCTTDFGLETLEEARQAEGVADDSDVETGGCGEGDFPWTKLTKK